jgi:hypothetical protein
MNDGEQLSAFAEDLANLVDRYAHEFDIKACAIVGILMMQIRFIQDRQLEDTDET